QRSNLGLPSPEAHIETSSRPGVAAINPPDYGTLVGELLDFLAGHTDTVVRRLESQMRAAATELEFEKAARLRDQLASVRKAIERQQMVGDKDEDYDAIGIAEDDLEASIQVFNVRRGRMVGRKGLVLEKVEELSPEALSARILERLYGDASADDVPKEVLIPVEPEELELYEEFLSHVRGSRVRIRVPKRG